MLIFPRFFLSLSIWKQNQTCYWSKAIFFSVCQLKRNHDKYVVKLIDNNVRNIIDGLKKLDSWKKFYFPDFDLNLIEFNIPSPSRYELRTPPRSSSQRRQLDLTLLAGQKVVKKYRRYARNNEFRRLKALVPSLLKKNEASKVK